MTKGTGIDINNEKIILKDGLKDLCRHHYLPFTTKQFDSAEKIIEGFLQTLKEKKVGLANQPLFASPAILGVVPGFHLLKDFQSWDHVPINSYQVLANVNENSLNKIVNIQASWAEPDNEKNFSSSVIERLNSGSRNGRIKIIIRLADCDEVEIQYNKNEKTIEYLIPRSLHSKCVRRVPKLKYHKGDIFTLKVDNSKPFERPPFPTAKLSNFKDFESAEEEFTKLALEIYPFAIQHLVYIDAETSLLYLFSNNTEIEDKDKDVGLGGMFLLLKRGIVDNLDCPDCRKIINYFSRLTDALSSRLINFYQVQEVKRQSLRAAISQVMARNMSHNMGSHVLNRLVDEAALSKIDVEKFSSYRSDHLEKNDKSPYSQIAIYNNYVKCRMDYLSDITFSTPVMQTNKRLWADLFKEFDRTRLLLEFISGLSDNFPYEIQFVNDKYLPLTSDNDFSIALPNDLLGCQAFYNIIENIIRNTAKHNQNKKKGKDDEQQKTIFTIVIKNIPAERKDSNEIKIEKSKFYQIEIFDSLPITGNKVFSNTAKEEREKNEYFNKTGIKTGNISNIDFLVYLLNEKINESILGEKNQLRGSSLGLLEMEASAAYLRKLDITNIEDDEYSIEHNDKIINSKGKLNVLKAIKHKNQLGFRFFVSKPSEFLFISDWEISADRKEQLYTQGIWIKTEAEFSRDLSRGIVYNHQFVLYTQTDTIGGLLYRYKTSLPNRSVVLNRDSNILQLLSSKSDFSIIEECVWSIWFNSLCNGKYDKVNVFTSYGDNTQIFETLNSYNIAFSDHNVTWSHNKKLYPKRINYLEPLSGIAQKKLPNFRGSLAYYTNINRGVLTDVIKWKLFESSTTKILVIDERIQRFLETTFDSDGIGVLNKEIYEYCNVIIPETSKILLDADNYTQQLTDSIMEFVDYNIRNCTFLVIHFSILERMYGSQDFRIVKALTGWAEHTKVIVTSGRGRPSGLPFQSVCYVNLSPVLNVFIQERNKYSINYLLNSARK